MAIKDSVISILLKAIGAKETAADINSVSKATAGLAVEGEKSGKKPAQGINEVKTAADDALFSVDKLSAAMAAIGAAAIAKAFIDANIAIEGNKLALNALAGSQEAANAQMQDMAQLAELQGINLTQLIGQWVAMSAAVKGTTLEGASAKNIFESVIGAGVKLGATTEKINNGLVAVQQMAAKGVISMEELRGQLSEAIPGAAQAMAKGLGVSLTELNALVESGNLAAEVALPALAKGLQDTFNLDMTQRVETLGAAVTNFSNDVTKAYTQIGQAGLSNVFAQGLNITGQALNSASSGTVALGQAIGAMVAYATGAIPSLEQLQIELYKLGVEDRARLENMTAQAQAQAQYEVLSKVKVQLLQQEAKAIDDLRAAQLKSIATPVSGNRDAVRAQAQLSDARKALVGVTAEVDKYEQALADTTANLANETDAAKASSGAYTEQQKMLADQIKGLTENTNVLALANAKLNTEAIKNNVQNTAAAIQVAASRDKLAIAEAELALAQVSRLDNTIDKTEKVGQAEATLEAARRESESNAVRRAQLTKAIEEQALAAVESELSALGQVTDANKKVALGLQAAVAEKKALVEKADLGILIAQQEQLAAAANRASQAIAGVRSAEQSLIAAQAKAAGNGPSNDWAQASTAASRANSLIQDGSFTQAAKEIQLGMEILNRAVAEGGPAALIDATRKQLHDLGTEVERSLIKGGSPKETDGVTKSAQIEWDKVRDQFNTPIPMSLDVDAAAQAAGAKVVATVQAALAGASFSVPVTAIVTVDAGGATPTGGGASDVSRAAAKTGTRPL